MTSACFILAALLCCLNGSPVQSAAAGGNDGFDYLMLSREWPFSFCTVESCNNKQFLQNKFNVHGLWAEVINASSSEQPQFCNATFNKAELGPLTAELQANWMDLKNPNGSALEFWSREFSKHGSCVVADSRFNTTYMYFKVALMLHEKYNLLDMLAKGGVTPGPDPVSATKIRSVLSDSFGFRPQVRCSNSNNLAYLYELRLCFTKDLVPMNCDSAVKRGRRPSRMLAALHRLFKAAAGFLRRGRLELDRIWWQPRPLQPPPSVSRRARGGGGPSGTYECKEDEQVLIPSSPAGSPMPRP